MKRIEIPKVCYPGCDAAYYNCEDLRWCWVYDKRCRYDPKTRVGKPTWCKATEVVVKEKGDAD